VNVVVCRTHLVFLKSLYLVIRPSTFFLILNIESYTRSRTSGATLRTPNLVEVRRFSPLQAPRRWWEKRRPRTSLFLSSVADSCSGRKDQVVCAELPQLSFAFEHCINTSSGVRYRSLINDILTADNLRYPCKMRAFSFLAFASVAYANIVFTHVPLQCNASNPQIYHGCLRGQQCLNDGSCEALPKETQPRSVVVKVKRAYSADGKCGASNGGLLCDPNSTVYKGTCCSQYGWCGNTVDYCGTGCQSGCSNAPSSTSPPAYSTDGKCGASNGGLLCDPNSKVYTGSCCSQYGWCGNTVDHCGTGCQSGCSNIPPTAPPRADGQCGKAFGGATCDPNGPYGGCCSQYGYCGKTDGHCLVENGCQSGCTDVSTTSKRDTPEPTSPSEPVVNPVSTTPVDSNAPVTIDGTCGASNGNTICGDWPKGNCCSMYGFW
jgi:hypothetical protein